MSPLEILENDLRETQERVAIDSKQIAFLESAISKLKPQADSSRVGNLTEANMCKSINVSPLERKYGTLHERLEVLARLRHLHATGEIELRLFPTKIDQDKWFKRYADDDGRTLNNEKVLLLLNGQMDTIDIHQQISIAQEIVDRTNEQLLDAYSSRDLFDVICKMHHSREFTDPSPAFPTSAPIM